jgi:hypothetical protein
MSGQRSSHTFAVAVVLAIAAVVGAVAIAAVWANDQLLDTGSWVSTSDRMLDSQEVRSRVSAFLVEELVAETDGQLGAGGEGEVAGQVLSRLHREAPHLAAGIVATPRFRQVWQEANRIGHRALVRILDEEGVERGGSRKVVIDLTPALKDLANSIHGAERAGLGNLGSYVEPGAARIEVLKADELDRAQDAVRAIRRFPVPAVIAILALFAFALLLGRENVPRTVGMVGLALALAGALALIARVLAGDRIVDSLLHRAADREAADAAWRIATSTVVDLGGGAIALGALLALFGFLLSDTGFASSFRESLGRLLAGPLARLWAAAFVVVSFIALLIWQPIAALGDPLGIALFAATIAAGAVILVRTSVRSAHPPAPRW